MGQILDCVRSNRHNSEGEGRLVLRPNNRRRSITRKAGRMQYIGPQPERGVHNGEGHTSATDVMIM